MSDSPTSTLPPAPGQLTYRIFTLRHDASIASAEIIDARHDDEAKAIASKMVNGHGIDLWERNRFLASYPPLSASAES